MQKPLLESLLSIAVFPTLRSQNVQKPLLSIAVLDMTTVSKNALTQTSSKAGPERQDRLFVSKAAKREGLGKVLKKENRKTKNFQTPQKPKNTSKTKS